MVLLRSIVTNGLSGIVRGIKSSGGICFATAAVMLLHACVQPPEPPLGPQAAKWVGPDRQLRVSWGWYGDKEPLKEVVTQLLAKRGVALVAEHGPLELSFGSIKDVGDREYFKKSKWVIADGGGYDTGYLVGESQSCFVVIRDGVGGNIVFVSFDYNWDFVNLEVDVLKACIDFALKK